MKDSEKKGKKVLHISKYYYPYLGGTESVCQDITIAKSKNSRPKNKMRH